MAVNIDKIVSVGGRALVDLLNYAVRAVQTDFLFTFLVGEYRQSPTTQKAVALYDAFCAPQALARVSAAELLPPVNPQLEVALRPLRANAAQIQAARSTGALAPVSILPPKFIFDALVLHLQEHSKELRRMKRNYRIKRSPSENLPGGRMNDGQRFFLDKVWVPRLRPHLIGVGFRRVSCIG